MLEASLIVLSVLLGFGISEWRLEQADHELTQRVLETIRREILANQQELEQAVANHEQVLIQMREQTEEEHLGIRPAILRNSAWSTAQATGATVHLDYEVTEIAAGLHELQNLHRDTQIIVFEQLAMMSLNAGRLSEAELQGMRQSTWSGFVGLERKLLEEYERALERVGA